MDVRRWVRALLVASMCWLVIGAAAAAAAAEWVLPLVGEAVVTRPFDPPATPYGPGHRGVDLAGAPGQVVLAAGRGVVGFAAPLAGRGVVTVVHDGGLRTTYEPVLAAVTVGQAVDPGAQLGLLQAGHPGCPVAACLHWGLLAGEVYLDPMSLLSPGPIRLFPRSGSPPVTNQLPAASTPPSRAGPLGGTVLAPVEPTTGPTLGELVAVAAPGSALVLGAGGVARRRPQPP